MPVFIPLTYLPTFRFINTSVSKQLLLVPSLIFSIPFQSVKPFKTCSCNACFRLLNNASMVVNGHSLAVVLFCLNWMKVGVFQSISRYKKINKLCGDINLVALMEHLFSLQGSQIQNIFLANKYPVNQLINKCSIIILIISRTSGRATFIRRPKIWK